MPNASSRLCFVATLSRETAPARAVPFLFRRLRSLCPNLTSRAEATRLELFARSGRGAADRCQARA